LVLAIKYFFIDKIQQLKNYKLNLFYKY
jgi:hypothetical protein